MGQELEQQLKDEVKEVFNSLAVNKVTKDLKKVTLTIKHPKSFEYRFKNTSLSLESPEVKLRLNDLKKFKDEHYEGRRDLSNDFRKDYINGVEQFFYKEADSKYPEKPEDEGGFALKEDVFLRVSLVEAVVLRKFDQSCVSVVTVDGEEFLVNVKENDWLGRELHVGDVLRVFKPRQGSDDNYKQLDPELVCCHHVNQEEATQFLENLKSKKECLLEYFLRCQAIWNYILNNSVTEENETTMFCQTIFEICDMVVKFQMTTIAKEFWASFKGTKFLNKILPIEAEKDIFQQAVFTFIENILTVIPECAIKVGEILGKMKIAQSPKCIEFMQKIINCMAENVTGAKDDLKNIQWNQIPLIPPSSELFAPATDWKNLPCIKVKPKKDDKADDKRKNDGDKVEDAKYSSEEEYLKTNFTLLREECFHNLKEFIRNYLKDGHFDNKNAMMYRVNLVKVGSDYSLEGLSYLLDYRQDSNDKATDIDPDNSRWLMNGNLLCISIDGTFRCPIWATVASMKEKDQQDKKKQVYITLCTEMNKLTDAQVITKMQQLNNQGKQAYMVESNTFFVAFGPSLEVLKQKVCVPFKEQLVDVEKCTNQPPDYLKKIKKRPDWKIFFKNPRYKDNTGDYSYDQLLKEFREMKDDDKCEPKLDEKQLQAVEQALCYRLGLIQGPPGTGKSFVGERLLQLLLTCLSSDDGPILVVTYKNFALDHFLEDCLASIPDFKSILVRVGGGSTSDDLESCKLFKLLQENRQGKGADHLHYKLERNLHNELDALTPEIQRCVKQLRFSNRSSHIAEMFIKEADEKHLKSLVGDELIDKLTREKKWRLKHYDELVRVIEQPLTQWMPSKEEFDKTLCKSYNDLGSYNSLQRSYKSGVEDEESGETDPTFEGNERRCAYDEGICESNDSNEMDEDNKEYWILPDITEESLGNFMPVLNAGNIKELKPEERIQMVYALKKQYEKSLSDRFMMLTEDVAKKCRTKKELKDQGKIAFLKKRKVIGMTVSGAAIRASWLETIKPSVMIVEEAAEILEPQLAAIIPSSVQHLIMIGDQEQLKPQVNNYILGRKCNLQVSMFERLIRGGLDYTQLNQQGRMTDELAELVRKLAIYDEYKTRKKDGEYDGKIQDCLLKSGLKSMFFYKHKKKEEEERGTHSKYNSYEAGKVAEFSKFLCEKADIEPSKITILCSYLAQVRRIKGILDENGYSSAQEIAVTTIDSFQGKENEIIILSMVRNNSGKDAKIGYLSLINRICVAVSRARCCLYMFGNAELLKRKSTRGWKNVIDWMNEKKCVGDIDKSIPFVNQAGERVIPDGPVSSQQAAPVNNTYIKIENIYGPTQFGNNNTMTTTSPTETQPTGSAETRPTEESRKKETSGSAESRPTEESSKQETPGSVEALPTEESRKKEASASSGTQETRRKDISDSPTTLHSQETRKEVTSECTVSQTTDDNSHMTEDDEAQEHSFHDPDLKLPEEEAREAREMSFYEYPRHESNVHHDGTEGNSTTRPTEEEKNNPAFQETDSKQY